MASKQSKIQDVTKKLDDMNVEELKQVRDYTDNRLHEKDDDYSKGQPDIQDMDRSELEQLRHDIDERLLSEMDSRQGSADVSADDEKKKYIAQNGDNPIAQERAQDVPQPESDEVKDLQNEKAEEEHQAKGAESEDEKKERLEKAGADKDSK